MVHTLRRKFNKAMEEHSLILILALYDDVETEFSLPDSQCNQSLLLTDHFNSQLVKY